MSYTMTHLIIADKIADRLHISHKDLFLLANMSPDAVHCRKDFSMVLKARAHFLKPDDKWGRIYSEESMTLWYDLLREFYKDRIKKVQNELQEVFLKGYTLHILVDIFNCKLLYAKNLLRYDFKVEDMRDEYRRECTLQDIYLCQNYERTEKIVEQVARALDEKLDEETLEILGLDVFINRQNIADSIVYFKSLYEGKAPVSLEGLEMLSAESTECFLNRVAEETAKRLYDFPEAGHTFGEDA